MTGIDLHQQITDRIVAAIETAGEFRLPWTGCSARPVNISSRAPYNGVNVLSLWIAALDRGYASNFWGTYEQWQAAGCQVRKGEKGTLVVFYRKIETDDEDHERLIARASHVFNAAQVDGYQAPALPAPFDPIPHAEAFVIATGARIEEGGDPACYVPSKYLIRMPDRWRFGDPNRAQDHRLGALQGTPSCRMFLQQDQTLPPDRLALRENRIILPRIRLARMRNGVAGVNEDAA